MSYPYVPAANDYGQRKGPVKAFLIHMAEGAGTVGYLDRIGNPPPRGVSVHYVIETTGRIVRMLDESHASGSIDPTLIRTDDDTDGFYGVTAAKAVMGDWWSDPNAAVISLEIEGYAKSGPSLIQHGSLERLVKDVRTRHPDMGLLGHRDFANYKACPGRLINWDELGGHGPQEDGMHITLASPLTGGKVAIPQGATAYRVSDGSEYKVPTSVSRDAVKAANVGGSGGYLVDLNGDELHFIYGSAVTFTSGSCADQVAAEHERTRKAAIEAVEGI